MSQLTLDDLRRAVQMVKGRAESEKYIAVVNIDDLLTVLRKMRRAGYKITRGRLGNGGKSSIWFISDGGNMMQIVPDRFRITPRGKYHLCPVKEFALPMSAYGITISAPDDGG